MWEPNFSIPARRPRHSKEEMQLAIGVIMDFDSPRVVLRQRRRLHCHGGCSAVGVPFTLISLICRSLRLWMLLLPVLPNTEFLLCFWFFPHFLLMACNMPLVLLFLALMFFGELRRLARDFKQVRIGGVARCIPQSRIPCSQVRARPIVRCGRFAYMQNT